MPKIELSRKKEIICHAVKVQRVDKTAPEI